MSPELSMPIDDRVIDSDEWSHWSEIGRANRTETVRLSGHGSARLSHMLHADSLSINDIPVFRRIITGHGICPTLADPPDEIPESGISLRSTIPEVLVKLLPPCKRYSISLCFRISEQDPSRAFSESSKMSGKELQLIGPYPRVALVSGLR
jgi:hypothetical protein